MKLVDALKKVEAARERADAIRVYLACGFEPLHFSPFLTAHLADLFPKQRSIVETGTYGDLIGNVERMRASGCALSVIVVEWGDLDPRLGFRRLGGWTRGDLAEAVDSARATLQRLLAQLESDSRRPMTIVVAPTLPLPPISPHAIERASEVELRLQESVAAFLVQAAKLSRVKVLDGRRLDELSPLGLRLDVRSELASGFPYRLPHADAIASMVARLMSPPAPKKGLVTDLDNTLWRGILGDDGPDGIGWTLEAKAQGHGLYQQLLHTLAESGILLAVASKNDPALANEALANPAIKIPKDRFFPLEIHWKEKSSSLSRILAAWNVGADSVVFVDDSPLEIAEVQAVYPEMTCLLFPAGDDEAMHRLLSSLRALFGKDSITSEDSIRLDSLRRQADLRAPDDPGSGHDNEALLASLEAELSFELDPPFDDPRPLELINKTNQFNLNGRRLSEGDYLTLRQTPGAFTIQVSYQDKFGPLGKIAVLAGTVEDTTAHVMVWVLSCRAFSRRIEHRCVQYLFERLGVTTLTFAVEPTPRNGPALEFFHGMTGQRSSGLVRIARADFAAPAAIHKINEVTHGE